MSIRLTGLFSRNYNRNEKRSQMKVKTVSTVSTLYECA